jgi:predicted nucleic-acid-binding protein
MKTILLDLNILLDYLFNRDGHEKVTKIIGMCVLKKLKGFVCAHEITTLSYFLNKSIKDKREVVKTIAMILKMFQIIEINEKILNEALYSEITDYEDAVIEISSRDRKIDYIITRNIKDFKKSIIKSMTPDEFIALQEN